MKPSQRYLLNFSVFSFSFIFGIAFISIRATFFDTIHSYQKLQQYQIQKLNSKREIDIVFVGDSSLGNAIDANLFSQLSTQQTVNLALTGAYGYAGSFNMTKKALERSRPKTVIIFQTLDVLQRKTSYEGYLYTLRMKDLDDLQPAEIAQLSRAFVNITFSASNLENIFNAYVSRWTQQSTKGIKNDYIEQGRKLKLTSNSAALKDTINVDELRFLYKLQALCQSQGIKLIYVHGPIWETVGRNSQSYIHRLNQLLDSDRMRLIRDVVLLPAADVGDEWDHVAPQSKQLYTRRYFQKLKPLL